MPIPVNWPTSLDTIPKPVSGVDRQDNPDHAELETAQSTAIERLQAKVGVDASVDTTTHDYQLAQLNAEVFAAPPATDVTYFVDPAGSDLNDGSSETAAFQTVAAINALGLAQGDVIGFKRGGQWREKLVVPNSGASGLPIRFTAYGDSGPMPLFQGDSPVTTWALTTAQTYTYEATLTTDPLLLFLEAGVPLTKQSSIATVEANAGSYWWNSNKVYVHAADNSNVSTNGRVYSTPTRNYGIDTNGKNWITIDRIAVEGTTTAGIAVTGTSANTVLDHALTRLNALDGVKCASTSVTNTLTRVWSWGNKATGIYLADPTGTNVLTDCASWDNGTSTTTDHGYRLENGAASTVRADECVAFNNTAHGFYGSDSTALTLARCLAYKNVNGAGIYFPNGSTGGKVYHCTSWGNKYGIQLNTNSTANVTVAEVKNSIFSDNTTSGVELTHATNNAVVTSWLNNDVHGNGTNFVGLAATVGLLNGSSSDPTGSNGNVSVDPLFVSELQRDFRLKNSSSLIDAGVVITGFHDLAGVGYLDDAPDLGHRGGGYDLGYVTVDEGQFTQEGFPWRYVGSAVYQMNSTGDYCGAQWGSGTDLATALDAATPQVVRGHAFQSLLSTPVSGVPTGVRDWGPLDHTISVCKARGIRVILVLTDQNGGCEEGGYKAREWYTSAWRTKIEPGNVTSHEQFIRDIVTRYRDEPTILSWEPVGEPEVKDYTGAGSCSTDDAEVLQAFFTDVAEIIRELDPNHLIGSCVIGGGQCGIQGSDYQALHALDAVDYATFHDYSHAADPIPDVLYDCITVARAVNKPLLNQECGIARVDDGGHGIDYTTAQRSTLYAAKLDLQRAAGMAAFATWNLQDVDDTTWYGYTPADEQVAMLQGRQR